MMFGNTEVETGMKRW